MRPSAITKTTNLIFSMIRIMDEMINLDYFLPISLSIKRLIKIAVLLEKYESIIPRA
jgi:hypothetical protein